jgi:HD-like signal output (HDOD) protein
MHSNPITLEDLVERTIDLPSLPAAAMAIVRETEHPSASARTIAQYVAQDQALAARILRLANSSYYGLSRQVMDVSDAVVILGMRCIRNLCMVASTYPWVVNPSNGYAFGPKEIWTHSFAVGVGAQIVADRSGVGQRDQALTAGLMHNLGKMALGVWHEKDMPTVMALAGSANMTAEAAERHILGYSHCEVGRHMAEAWNLPKPLVEVMGYHHDPNACGSQNVLVDCVHVADYLTMSMGLGLGGDGSRYDFHPESLTRLGIHESSLEGLANECEAAYSKHEKLYELAA